MVIDGVHQIGRNLSGFFFRASVAFIPSGAHSRLNLVRLNGNVYSRITGNFEGRTARMIATELPSLPAHQVKVFPRILGVREFAFVA